MEITAANLLMKILLESASISDCVEFLEGVCLYVYLGVFFPQGAIKPKVGQTGMLLALWAAATFQDCAER